MQEHLLEEQIKQLESKLNKTTKEKAELEKIYEVSTVFDSSYI